MTKSILITVARFYEDIADNLINSAVDTIEFAGFTPHIMDVPGCFEIPAAISMGIASQQYVGYIGLGCVIRGETSHYDYVCNESARGINELAITHQAAIGYGIITAENKEQALVRADKNQKDVGGRAAKAAIHMIQLKQSLITT